MTDEERAQLERWQFTDGGRAELALHALSLSANDLEAAACTREGFTTIRKSRAMMIKAREVLDHLIANTAILQEAAE